MFRYHNCHGYLFMGYIISFFQVPKPTTLFKYKEEGEEEGEEEEEEEEEEIVFSAFEKYSCYEHNKNTNNSTN